VISKGHKKHKDLVRASYGSYGRNEWAILGTDCNNIKAIANKIMQTLSTTYKCAYIDTKHTKGDTAEPLPDHLASGCIIENIDHLTYQQFNYHKKITDNEYKQLFSQTDIVLVNGNHHQAKSQIIVIDSYKKLSLQKRVDQLNNVQLILLADNEDEVFDFIKVTVKGWEQLPICKVSNIEAVIQFVEQQMKQAVPFLNGLVLAGGKSVRMGYDKNEIKWHGKEQMYFMYDMLQQYCKDVYISCRHDQQLTISGNYKSLPDTFTDLGPYGAILSAFRNDPNVAWLVIACDMPLLSKSTIEYLVDSRSTTHIATTFQSPHDNLPEPLITIWEPKSYPVLLSFLSLGSTCPRKVLQKNEIHMISAFNTSELMNVNTPEDIETVKSIIKQNNIGKQ